MKAVIEIVRHELISHRNVVIAAAAVGVLTPLMVIWERDHPQVLALTLGTAFGLCTAVFLGSSSLLREQRADTLSLYLGLPTSEGSVWWGKLLGSVTVAMAGQALAALPALVLFAGRLHVTTDLNRAYGVAFLILLPLAALAHFVATSLRAEPDLLVLDLGALVVLGGVFLLGHTWLFQVTATGAMALLGTGVATVLCVATLVGGHYQLKRGRCDLRQGRAALSRAVWVPVFVAALLALGAARWTSDLRPGTTSHQFSLNASKTSPWISYGGLVMGETSLRTGARAGFLHNVETGEWHRLPRQWKDVATCDDGKSAVRLQEDQTGLRLVTFDLSSLDEIHDVAWPWHEPLQRSWAGLSPDCALAAVVSVLWAGPEGPYKEGRILVVETATGDVRFDSPLGDELFVGGGRDALFAEFDATWLSASRLRIFATSASRYQVLDVETARRAATASSAFVAPTPPGLGLKRAIRNRDETRHLLHSVSDQRSHLTLVDENGASLWTHDLDDGARSRLALLGEDVVISQRTSADSSTIFLLRDGGFVRKWPVDYDRVFLGSATPQGGLLLLAAESGADIGSRSGVFHLDPESSELEQLDTPSLPSWPVLRPHPDYTSGPSRQTQADETSGRLWRHVGKLWTFDPETPTARQVI